VRGGFEIGNGIGSGLVCEVLQASHIARPHDFDTVLFSVTADNSCGLAVIVEPNGFFAPGDTVGGVACQSLGAGGDESRGASLADTHLSFGKKRYALGLAVRLPITEEPLLCNRGDVLLKRKKGGRQRNGPGETVDNDLDLFAVDGDFQIDKRSGGVAALGGVEDGLKRDAGLNVCVERNGRAGEIELKVGVAARSVVVALAIIQLLPDDVLVFENLEGRLRGRGATEGPETGCARTATESNAKKTANTMRLAPKPVGYRLPSRPFCKEPG
jgi:hypothetical protein